MERAGVEEEDLYEAFGPLIDVGEGSRMGFLDRRIARMVMNGPSGELGLELDMGGRNDLRDWDRIREFVHRRAPRSRPPNPTTMVIYVGIYRKTRTLDARLHLYHHFDIVGAIFFL